ncbi:MAG: MBL fold metallo-hydrolase [Acidobacteria bacterium]|nr:MBL fold metallo-hydrolase [Acidobacteriota bacterium]
MGIKIGDVSITPIIEIDYPVPASFLLPDATPENLAPDLDWLEPHFVTPNGERLKMIIQAFLVESRGLKIVVDTCVGNDKKRALPAWNELDGPFLQEIRDAGFPREQVDLVVCTHLHIDHVGWNTMKVDGEWVPTFPNARYVMARPEFEYWRDEGEVNWGDVFGDSVAPVFEAGLVDLVDCDHEINPELQFFPTPGHTPGHCSIAVSSGSEEGVISGDVMHHPCQCAHPEWCSIADVDRDAAVAARRGFCERFSDTGITVVGTHWAAPTAVLLTAYGDVWKTCVD